MYNLSTRDRPAAENIEGVIDSYVGRLTSYQPDVVRDVLRTWPSEHSEWPSWHELEAKLNTVVNRGRPALPPPRPEHRLLRPDRAPPPEPFATRAEWDGFVTAMRALRDPSQPMLCRESLLSIGEEIEARQLPHAENMGWV